MPQTQITQITLTTTKGTFTGTRAECGAWLAEMQPSSVRAERGEVSAEVEVAGTPGALTYERAIEAALAHEAGERSCGGCGDVGPVAAHHNGVPYCQGCEDAPSEADDERECLLRAADDRIAALRTESAIAGDREQVALCDRALNGDEAARDECARVLAEATREHAAE